MEAVGLISYESQSETVQYQTQPLTESVLTEITNHER